MKTAKELLMSYWGDDYEERKCLELDLDAALATAKEEGMIQERENCRKAVCETMIVCGNGTLTLEECVKSIDRTALSSPVISEEPAKWVPKVGDVCRVKSSVSQNGHVFAIGETGKVEEVHTDWEQPTVKFIGINTTVDWQWVGICDLEPVPDAMAVA